MEAPGKRWGGSVVVVSTYGIRVQGLHRAQEGGGGTRGWGGVVVTTCGPSAT